MSFDFNRTEYIRVSISHRANRHKKHKKNAIFFFVFAFEFKVDNLFVR